MEKGHSTELLSGNLKKNLLKMSIPTMMGFLLQSVYDIVDIIWVGRISSSAVAGVTIFSTVFWMVEILNGIIGSSSVSLISQSYGSGDMKKTKIVIQQTFTFKALVALIAAALMFIFLKPLLHFFSSDPEVLEAAFDYGYIRIFFLPVMFSSYTVNTALRCLGDAKTPMIIMGIASILNIILDPIFMFETIPGTSLPGFGMGVFGAGLATVISIVIAFSVGFSLFLTGRTKVTLHLRDFFKLDWETDKRLILIGLPSGIDTLFRQLSGVLTLKFVALYGTTAVAAAGIGNKIFGFAFMPLVGFVMGGGAIVGQCLGANDVQRAKETTRFATVINVSLMAVVSVVALLFPEAIMKIFIQDSAVIQVGIPMIKIITPSLIAAGIAMGLSCVFSGSGHNMPYLLSSIISRWAIQIPLLFIFVTLLNLPITYVWITFVAAELAGAAVMYGAYIKGTWETKRV